MDPSGSDCAIDRLAHSGVESSCPGCGKEAGSAVANVMSVSLVRVIIYRVLGLLFDRNAH